MATTRKQLAANRKNAKKSTGPVTPIGKQKASRNATRHGILSNQLVLPHENEAEFFGLLEDMTSELHPVGTIETALVEKITINLWRQRRLAHAETAMLGLQTLRHKLEKEVLDLVPGRSFFLGPHTSTTPIDDAENPDHDQAEWCKATSREIEAFKQTNSNDFAQLEKVAPNAFLQLRNDAKHADGSIQDLLLDEYGSSLSAYLGNLKHYCDEYTKAYENRHAVLEIAKWVQAKKSITFDETERKLSRYQTTLDNELYKAMKNLREQQQWRKSSIDVEVISEPNLEEDDDEAA